VRTPNTFCFLCKKPLYRRPSDISKARYSACMACRSEAQKVAGITDKQKSGLSLGRKKGTNHRTGYKHREESKRKASASHIKFCRENPELIVRRGAKTRGSAHYKWNGGSSKLNKSIRQLTEHRKWMESVRNRDGSCKRCGSIENLESHHKIGLAELIRANSITTREQARACAELWDLTNGETLCQSCHYSEHGRQLPCE
jgi:5-methylcytosine-specific restriction endonuclease McrA